MWLGALGEINIYEQRIDLQTNAKPLNSPPFRAGPKKKQLDQAEVEKKVKASGI